MKMKPRAQIMFRKKNMLCKATFSVVDVGTVDTGVCYKPV